MKETIRLVQLAHPVSGRRLALVREPQLIILNGPQSAYELAQQAIRENKKIDTLITSFLSAETIPYDSVYEGSSEWKLLPSFDHPQHPASCLVSGTGLTHKNSALNRQMMHQATETKMTDSMKIYQWGVEGGHPERNEVGVQPEWFYKGTGDNVRAHGETLVLPGFGDDGGEEPEVAGVYMIDSNRKPWRIGFTTGNEFSDHVMEKKNYLYLAPSKLRNCAIGPELVIVKELEEVSGTVSVFRNGALLWSSPIKSGEKNMAHSIANLEHHHFKYPGHRVPGQAHIHFFGADAFSFGSQVKLEDGDRMQIEWEGFGRPLRNNLEVDAIKETPLQVSTLL